MLDGDPAARKGHSSLPHFSVHVYCQTAGWIKMPLGTEVDLSPGDIVLHGDPGPPRKGRPVSIVAKLSLISATAELLFSRVRIM